jgi:hypothetical protein
VPVDVTLDVLELPDELRLPGALRLLVPDVPRPIRGRIGPGRLFGLPAPIERPRPDELRSVVTPGDGLEVAGLVRDGVSVAALVTGEPAVDEQLTPGVMIDDVGGAPEVLPVPVDEDGGVDCGVVCANAGAALKAIAHTRPAPLRIGIFRIVVKVNLL